MIIRLVSAFVIATSLAFPATAQTETGSVQFNFLKVEGLTVGTGFALDDEYEQQAGRPVPPRLKMTLPTDKEHYQIIVDNQPSGGAVKIFFATHDRVLIDSLHIIDAKIPMGPIKERLTRFAGLLKDQGYPMAVENMENPKLIALRDYQMGRYAAVELIATYTDPNTGPMYLRILGVPHPEKAESIFIMININASLVPLNDVAELPNTLSGRAVDTIRFTE